MSIRFPSLPIIASLLALLLAAAAHAEPYLAIANGYKCSQCHVNPTGGGARTPFGEIFAQTVLPARHLDTGGDVWTGQLNRFLAIGGDLRFDASSVSVPGTKTTNSFDTQQARVYLEASLIPNRLLVYVDEQVAPGGALNREAWGMFWSADHTWYIKGGQMYLPFGFRLQDQTAYVNISGIYMQTPDNAIEVGYSKGRWDAQLAVSNGTATGPTTTDGKQGSLQLQYVQTRWRLGVAANINDAAAGGDRDSYGLFGGLKTGPIAWLAEAVLVDDRTLAVGRGQRQLATLLEGNYSPARGHNLKVTFEYMDPDRDVANNSQNRWSFIYEYSPFQFLQLRGGARYNDGIPQAPEQHTKLYFVELHGFF